MRRFNSIALAVLLILMVLLFGQTVLPQITNLFTDTGRKIEAVQMMKA